jgi:predicted nucleic acid-binding protein
VLEGKAPLVLDANVIINFLGSGIPEKLFGSLDVDLIVAEQVFREVMHDPSRRVSPQAWLKDIEARCLIEIVKPSGSALETYLELASEPHPNHLDDGEAATIAVAFERGGIAVLDEERARRICQARYPAISFSSTVDLLHRVSMTGKIPKDEFRATVFKALCIAKMQVRAEMLKWVINMIGEEDAKQCPSLSRKIRNIL